MRITGGLARGILLKSVNKSPLRPATGYLRQAIFSSLGERIIGRRFLDLFAGTGSYGLEALSRGASSGVFVEKDPAIKVVLEKNLMAVCKSIGCLNENRIWNCDVFKLKTEERFDLIFIAPPYALARLHGGKLLNLGQRLLMESGHSLLIFEIPGDMTLAQDDELQKLGLQEVRRLGKRGTNSPTALIYIQNF
jgi:16S rRNA (guanine966-N2)-methyltransferase